MKAKNCQQLNLKYHQLLTISSNRLVPHFQQMTKLFWFRANSKNRSHEMICWSRWPRLRAWCRLLTWVKVITILWRRPYLQMRRSKSALNLINQWSVMSLISCFEGISKNLKTISIRTTIQITPYKRVPPKPNIIMQSHSPTPSSTSTTSIQMMITTSPSKITR